MFLPNLTKKLQWRLEIEYEADNGQTSDTAEASRSS